jgi:hypothetical protein
MAVRFRWLTKSVEATCLIKGLPSRQTDMTGDNNKEVLIVASKALKS